jgi:outer membrane lipoprotein-sorting protein
MTARYASMAAVLAWTAVSLHAQQADPGAQALAALREMQAAYKAVNALHVKVTWSAKYGGSMTADEFPLPGPDTLELRMQRPNKFYMSAAARRRGSSSSYLVVSDGTTLSYWRSTGNTYLQVKAPDTIPGMLALLPDTAIGTSVQGTWNADSIFEWDALVDERPLVDQNASPTSGQLMMGDPETLGGAPVRDVRVTPPAAVMPFRVEQRFYIDTATHLVRGLGTSARGLHPDNGRDFSVEMLARYDVFTTQPAFTDADFTFVPPRGAKPGAVR